MKITEIKRDLFDIPNDYSLAHCISEDCAMGAGIAVTFDKKFKGMKNWIAKTLNKHRLTYPCVAIYEDKNRYIFNMITKKKYWNKPTYNSITMTIQELAFDCAYLGVKKLAMPKIGCGLDRLQWGKVREIIEKEFNDLDIEILVCHI